MSYKSQCPRTAAHMQDYFWPSSMTVNKIMQDTVKEVSGEGESGVFFSGGFGFLRVIVPFN